MIQKKICMLGAFAAGKTSLVERFVRGIFSPKYFTTVGVKVDKKSVEVRGREMSLILWDLHGEDRFQEVRKSYMRGASGYLLVVDGTRRETLDTALVLHRRAREAVGDVPFVLLLNKADLKEEWEISESVLGELGEKERTVIETSAKTGRGVDEAFRILADRILEG